VHWSSSCLEPREPLPPTITSPATFNGQSTEEHQDPHRPQLDELCIDIWMTESLTTSCGLSSHIKKAPDSPGQFKNA